MAGPPEEAVAIGEDRAAAVAAGEVLQPAEQSIAVARRHAFLVAGARR
jgi:hypothetical protein